MLPGKIDTHAHFIPPNYRQALIDNGHALPDNMPGVPPWSPEGHLQLMAECNITKSILSISSPGSHLVDGDDALAARVARMCNQYAADLKKQCPSKFGFFASLPLPAVSETLQEITIASAQGANGFLALTNFHGHYLGDAAFEPVMAELNRRKAVVMLHPTTPCVAACLSGTGQKAKAVPLPSYRTPMYEFLFDTARAVINLFMSGTMRRYKDITFILPHAGGALPPLFSRFSTYSQVVPGGLILSEDEVRTTLLRQCYFDLAGWVFPSCGGRTGQLSGLVDGVGIPARRLLVGTDYCFTQAEPAKKLINDMDRGVRDWFDDDEVEDIYHRNAERMLKAPPSARDVQSAGKQDVLVTISVVESKA